MAIDTIDDTGRGRGRANVSLLRFPPSVAALNFTQALSSLYRNRRWLPDPDFASLQDVDIYNKVRRDPVIEHAMTYRKHLVAGRDWFLEPSGKTPEDKRAVDVVEFGLKKIHRFSAARFNLSDAVFRSMRVAFMEGARVAADPEGKGVIQQWWFPFRLRDVDKWRFRQISELKDDKLNVFWELWSVARASWEKLEHPEWFVRHVYEDTEQTLGFGRGLLEALYYFFYFKGIALREGMQGLERWAQGWVTAKIDGVRLASTDKKNVDQIKKWLDVLEIMKGRKVLAYGGNDEIKVIEGGGQGWQIVREILTYLDNSLVRLILGATLPTGGGGGGGSFARAEVEANSTEALVQYDRTLLEETITRDVLGLMWKLNRPQLAQIGLGKARCPVFKIRQEKREDPAQTANTVKTLLTIEGLKLKQEEVYRRTGFTQPDDDDTVFVGKAEASPAPFLFDARKQPESRTESSAVTVANLEARIAELEAATVR